MKLKGIFILFIVFFLSGNGICQVLSIDSNAIRAINSIPIIKYNLGRVNNDSLIDDDSEDSTGNKRYRYGLVKTVNYNSTSHGSKFNIGQNRCWMLDLKS